MDRVFLGVLAFFSPALLDHLKLLREVLGIDSVHDGEQEVSVNLWVLDSLLFWEVPPDLADRNRVFEYNLHCELFEARNHDSCDIFVSKVVSLSA